jgi:hypothetical protein
VVINEECSSWYWTCIPEQTPATQVPLMHVTGEPQAPIELHVSTPLPEHCTAPGVHTPMQTPFTHAWFVQGTALPQAPLPLHVCTALPEHCPAFGVHTPVQAPFWQA